MFAATRLDRDRRLTQPNFLQRKVTPESALVPLAFIFVVVIPSHDAFAAHLYRSRREYRSACQRAGKADRAMHHSSFRIAESMSFKGEFRQCEGLLQIDD
jgi:hypothetical protein